MALLLKRPHHRLSHLDLAGPVFVFRVGFGD
jgi:hypothetical protein